MAANPFTQLASARALWGQKLNTRTTENSQKGVARQQSPKGGAIIEMVVPVKVARWPKLDRSSITVRPLGVTIGDRVPGTARSIKATIGTRWANSASDRPRTLQVRSHKRRLTSKRCVRRAHCVAIVSASTHLSLAFSLDPRRTGPLRSQYAIMIAERARVFAASSLNGRPAPEARRFPAVRHPMALLDR
jgi:hypothetical protein